MPQELKFIITKEPDGALKGTTPLRKEFDNLLPGRWVVTLAKYKKKRSLSQNGLIHMYFQIIADETGNSLDRVKNILKKEFLTTDLKNDNDEYVCNPKTGEPLTYVRDTSDLNTVEMGDFTEKVRIWALDWGITLPLPEDQFKLNY